MKPEIRTPKVTLLTWTQFPLETVYSLWEASKNEKPLIAPNEVYERVDPAEVRKLFKAVIEQRIPVGESVDFVFMLENVSVSWREQAVRHRIGTKPSLERIGADIGAVDVAAFPDLADSVWWSQSMRIQSMGDFADRGLYRVPESLEGKTVTRPEPLSPGLDPNGDETIPAEDVYRETMAMVQEAYNQLVAAGVPMEDARELIPLGAQHRISWKLNISALQHILGKRVCWILQQSLWGPIVEGMISELVEKVDPIFSELATPPCVKGDEFKGCIYHEENRRRYTGDDAHPPCPLHVVHHWLPEHTLGNAASVAHGPELEKFGVPRVDEMRERAGKYRRLWGRDPYTGKRSLPVVP